jgi:RimJ/RimL family protein N-acetyltransferase
MSVVYYRGQRIDLRPIEPDDEPQLRHWINDPKVWATLNHRGPINQVRQREWIDNHGKNSRDYQFGIVVRENGALIGTTGLHGVNPVSHSATFGLMIGDTDYHNRGFGTETAQLVLRFAFEELNLNRVQLDVFDFNERAIRVYEKAGYIREGRRRQAFYRHGEYRDVLIYSVLRAEWVQRQAHNTESAEAGRAPAVA